MIVASIKPDGKKVYFDALTGNRYFPARETGRHEGRIPNDVIRFLTPKIESQRSLAVGNPITPNVKKDSKLRIVPPEKHSWWSRFCNWFKSFIDGRK